MRTPTNGTTSAPATIASAKFPLSLTTDKADIRAKHVERAMRDIDHFHKAQCQREPARQQEQ